MPDDQITDAKDLLKRVSDFGEELKERRRFERKKLLWAATVEVRGQRFEGMIVDLSAGGARIKFDAPVAAGDELTLVLKQLDELGAKVVWQREGEAGLQFLLAPDEVAARIQRTLPADGVATEAVAPPAAAVPRPASQAASPTAAPQAAPPPRADAKRRRLFLFAAAGVLGLGVAAAGTALLTGFGQTAPQILAFNAGDSDQHSCSNLMGKVSGSSNQLDFSLKVASAANAKCLDVHHLGPSDDNNGGRIVRTTKLPVP